MKRKRIKFSQRYAAALRRHLKHGPNSSLLPAFRLGSAAVVLGLEALELARIHKQARVLLQLSGAGAVLMRQVESFFCRSQHGDQGHPPHLDAGQN